MAKLFPSFVDDSLRKSFVTVLVVRLIVVKWKKK